MSSTSPKRFLTLATLALLTATAGLARAEAATMSECLSANESSIKLRSSHQLRAARDQALVCAASSCPDEVRDTCQNRVTELSAAIPTIVFLAKDGSGHDLVTVGVSMDGELLADRLDGAGLPIDPGPHTFTFEVAGQPAVELSLVIGEGQKDRHETVILGAAAAPIASAMPSPIGRLPAGPPAMARTPSDGQRIVGVVAGAVGVVGLGIGAVFGVLAGSDWSNAKAYCAGRPASCHTSGPGAQDEFSADSNARISTVGFIAGGAFAAAGVLMFLTALKSSPIDPPASARRVDLIPSAGPGGTGLTVGGRF